VVLRVTADVADGRIQSFINSSTTVLKQNFSDNTVIMDIRLGKNQLPQLQRFKPVKIEEIKE